MTEYRRNENYHDMIARLFPPPNDGKKHKVVNATIQVTDACNLRCTYCYQINKSTHRTSFETGKKFIDMLLQETGGIYDYFDEEETVLDGIILEFIGGEPLLEIDLMNQLTEYFVSELIRLNHPLSTKWRISISSNGTLYFDPRVQEYLNKYKNNVSFSISIDGNKELHDSCRLFPDGTGSYDIAMKAVKHYTEFLHGYMGSKMTLAPQNISHTFEALQSLIENGYTEINLNCVYEEGWTFEHAKILYEQLKLTADYLITHDLSDKIYISMFESRFFRPKDPSDLKNWCGGLGDMISVDYKGDLYPCIRYMESSLGNDAEPIIIGTIDGGILKTEKQKECLHCLRCVDRRTQSTDECFNCPIAEGCSWCSAYNYQTFGTANHRATFICPMHKARALGNAYYWNLKYQMEHLNLRMKLYIPKEWALDIIDEDEWNMLKDLEGPQIEFDE